MESTLLQETTRLGLVQSLDRLGEKVESAKRLIVELRRINSELSHENEGLRSERAIILESANVQDMDALLNTIESLSGTEKDNRKMIQEREEISKRVEALIEKVDLLEQGS